MRLRQLAAFGAACLFVAGCGGSSGTPGTQAGAERTLSRLEQVGRDLFFDIQLSDVDRNVYETMSIRFARHKSETEEKIVTREIAYCLEYADWI